MIFTVLLVPPALAQEEDDTEREVVKDGVEHKVEIDTGEDRVKIESSRETESGENETEQSFEVDFSVQMDPRIEISRKSEVETAGTESGNESSMKVRFRSIVEFEDDNGNGVYDSGEEVDIYDLSDTEYTDVEVLERSVNGSQLHTIESSSSDGVFTVRMHAVGSFTKLGSETVSPNEVKIDLEIHDYPYSQNDTRLALETRISSEKEFESESGDEEESVEVKSKGAETFFSWRNQAEVDGETTTVGSSEMEDEDEKTVYLSYERGEDIIHDPKVGIRDQQTTAGTGFLQRILSSLLAALGL